MQAAVAPRVSHSRGRQSVARRTCAAWNSCTAAIEKASMHSRLSLMSKNVRRMRIAFMFAYTLFGSPPKAAQRPRPNRARPRPASITKRASSRACSRVRNESSTRATSGPIQTMFEKPDGASASLTGTPATKAAPVWQASSTVQPQNQGSRLQDAALPASCACARPGLPPCAAPDARPPLKPAAMRAQHQAPSTYQSTTGNSSMPEPRL
ncbi:MAG TPA: hypothetical protein DDZ22_01170 [Massilia sp.]|nr:hypothetical protein [Massilia sp.]